MTRPKARLNHLASATALLGAVCFVSQEASAGKIDFSLGYYTMSVTNSSQSSSTGKSSSFSGPSFRTAFHYTFVPHVEFVAGYNVFMASLTSSNLGYGLEAGLAYYPLTSSEMSLFESSGVTWKAQNLWRPYLAVSFNQREFQGVQTSYAGFGVGAGVERTWTGKMSWKVEGRFIGLSSGSVASATYLDVLGGLVFGF